MGTVERKASYTEANMYDELEPNNPVCDECGDMMAATAEGYQCEGCTRETLGKLVRETWVKYCLETGDFKESHIKGWDFLSEWDKEVDRRIGEAVHRYVIKNRLSLV